MWTRLGVFAGGAVLGGAVLFLTLNHLGTQEVPALDIRMTPPPAFIQAPGSDLDVAADTIQIGVPTSKTVDDALRVKEVIKLPKGTRALLVPHHLVAAREIGSLFAAVQKPSVVYLLAPDHFSQGRTVLTTTDAAFASETGSSKGVPDIVADLTREIPELRNDRRPFIKEHGVTGLVPFMTRVWGDVTIVPMIIRIDANTDVRNRLAIALADRLRKDPRALLVSTVDFSHYLPAAVADFHDILSEDIVRALADLETDRAEIDSPGALAVALKAARELGLGNVAIHAHTNSLRLLQAVIAQDSTSHFTASFAPGATRLQETATLLFTGDVMLDRTVRDRIVAANDPLYPFQKIRGQEDRFFHGQDAVVVNLEGPVTPARLPPEKEIDFAFDPSVVGALKTIGITTVSQANNHSLDQGRSGANESLKLLRQGGLIAFGDQVRDDADSSLAFIDQRGQKIALVGFNITDNPLDTETAAATLARTRTEATRVVVFMHWGSEYTAKPNKTQTDTAHWLIDHGADAVVGAHPHWMEGVEVYKGRPIAYSLGNFVFDQDWSEETKLGLVAGLAFKSGRTELHLFPIRIDKSQPRLLTGEDRTKRLEYLASLSDPALGEMIKNGMLVTNPTP